MKKALFVTTVPITLRAFLLPLAAALHAEGWQVDALTGSEDGTGSNQAQDIPNPDVALNAEVPGQRPDDISGADSEEVGASFLLEHFAQIHTVNWSRSPKSFLRYSKLAREIRQLVTSEQYKVVHVHTPIASLITRLALRKNKEVRIIYTVHGFHFYHDERGHLKGRLYRAIERIAIHYTDVLTVMNDEDEAAAHQLAAKTRKLIHGDNPNTRVNRYPVPRCTAARIDGVGIDMDTYSPTKLSQTRKAELQQHYKLAADSFTVGMIAEMNHNKRHHLLLEAAKQLKDSHPHIHWLCIGTGPLKAQLQEQVQHSNLPVSFTGQLDKQQLREALALTNLGILVSKREGLPRSLMEFTAAKVPIAGTKTRGIVEEVQDKRALANTATGPALAELIASIADNPSLATDLAQKQHVHATQNYTLDVVIPKYLKLYENR